MVILSQEDITACKTPQVSCIELLWGTWSEEKLLFQLVTIAFFWGHYSQVSLSSSSSAFKMKNRLTVFKFSLHRYYVDRAAAFGEYQVPQSASGSTQAYSFLHGTAWQNRWPYFPFQDTHPHPICTSITSRPCLERQRGCIPNQSPACSMFLC